MGKSPKRANRCHLYQKKSEGEMEEGGSKGPSDLPWSPPLKVKEAHAGVPTQMTTTRLPHSAPDAGHWACLAMAYTGRLHRSDRTWMRQEKRGNAIELSVS